MAKPDPIHALRLGLPPDEDSGIFGASISPDEAQLIIISVPWDITCSYGSGSSLTPEALILPSHQLDFASDFWGPAFELGICLLPANQEINELYQKTKTLMVQQSQRTAAEYSADELRAQINHACSQMNAYVQNTAEKFLKLGKHVAVLGGDHSSPLGLIRALDKTLDEFAILHIDAHHDLRIAYEGYTYSHASIMYNALKETNHLKRIVQVGIRDYSLAEADFSKDNGNVITSFYDTELFRKRAYGETWSDITEMIILSLNCKYIYISLDIDGLSPFYCPSTGTPVPGGLSFNEVQFLLEELIRQDKKIVGFDLCEVVPHPQSDWDLNVAARLLYRLCCTIYASNKL